MRTFWVEHDFRFLGYHMREAGSTAVQEVAFTLANGIAYVQAGDRRRARRRQICPRGLSFFFNAHTIFWKKSAKFRAARRMWAHIDARSISKRRMPCSGMLRFHTQTAGSTLSAQQPENNIVRTAIQGHGGGPRRTQSLHTNGYDEALALPLSKPARIALRTQQIVAFRIRCAANGRSLAGSYYIEALTNEIEKRAARIS